MSIRNNTDTRESASLLVSEENHPSTVVVEEDDTDASSQPPITIHSIYRNNKAEHDALLNKVTWRLLPFLFVLYTFSFLDRSNLSNVHKTMLADIHLDEDQYGTAASIFFLPYVLLEIPSNMILERVDARRWLARIIFTWGMISTLMLAITGYGGLMIARFLLGVAEAGFFPGIIFYLTLWFTPAERAQRLAFIFVAQPVSGILGGLLAYPILKYLNGVAGMAGWRWVFLLEGSPTVFLGVATWFYLPAKPMEALWLTLEEREFLTARMKGFSLHGDHGSGSDSSSHHHHHAVQKATSPQIVDERDSNSSAMDMVATNEDAAVHLTDGEGEDKEKKPISAPGGGAVRYSTGSNLSPATLRAQLEVYYADSRAEIIRLYHSTFSNKIIYYCIVTNFLILMPVQAITFYLPSIVAEIGVDSLTGNLISAIPYSVAGIMMFLVSFHSDKTGERAKHIIACNVVGFVSMAVTAATMSIDQPSVELIFWQLFFLSWTAAGVWSCKPALMALFTTNLQGNIAVAIAAVTTVGNISGIVAPLIMSALRSNSGNYASGCLFLMSCLVVASWTVYGLNREIQIVNQRKLERSNGVQLTTITSNGTSDSDVNNDTTDASSSSINHRNDDLDAVPELAPPPTVHDLSSVADAINTEYEDDATSGVTIQENKNRSKLK